MFAALRNKPLTFVQRSWKSTVGNGKAAFKQQQNRAKIDVFKDLKVSTRNNNGNGTDGGSLAVYTIAGMNVAICAAWQAVDGTEHSAPERGLTRLWMDENMAVSTKNWEDGRWWTLITSMFSHQSGLQCDMTCTYCKAANMLVWTHFGLATVPLLAMGAIEVFSLYSAAGLASSAVYLCALDAGLGKDRDRVHKSVTATHTAGELYKAGIETDAAAGGEAGTESGATASTMAMLVACSASFPAAVRSFFGYNAVPVPAIAGAFIALDLYESSQSKDGLGGIARSSGHLCGAAAGLLFYGLAIRRGKLSKAPPL